MKYVLIVMRADNDGEGGIMALAALVSRIPSLTKRATAVLMALGVFGAALFYGDGMVTPAVSVLSALEGIEVVAPGMSHWVIPTGLIVLVGLFVGAEDGHRPGWCRLRSNHDPLVHRHRGSRHRQHRQDPGDHRLHQLGCTRSA